MDRGREAMTSDVLAVWGAWREYHPSARGTPSAGAATVIRAALRDWSASDLALVVAWAHDAPHDRASYLRGAEYERHRRGEDARASSVGAYLAPPNLLTARTLDQRVAWATEWGANGRPVFTEGATSTTSAPAAPDEAEAAWAWFAAMMRAPGRRPDPTCEMHRRCYAAADDLGLWRRWRELPERELPYVRRDFCRAYTTTYQRAAV